MNLYKNLNLKVVKMRKKLFKNVLNYHFYTISENTSLISKVMVTYILLLNHNLHFVFVPQPPVQKLSKLRFL